jgi:exopolysaccharide biosynthesis polyprenyl glycosylphosphotransferase
LWTGRILAIVLPIVTVVFVVPGLGSHQRVVGAAVLSVIWLVSIGLAHALNGPALKPLGLEVATLRGVLIAVVVSAVTWAAWLPGERLPLAATCFLVLTVFILAAAWEAFALRKLRPAVRLLFVGEAAAAESLLRDLPAGGGYALLGVVDGAEDSDGRDPDVRRLRPLSQLAAAIVEHKPDLVILATGCRTPATFSGLLDAAEAGFRVVTLAEFHEYAFGRVPLDELSHDWFMSVLHLYQRRYSSAVKRGLDLVGASVLLVVTLPLFPLMALLVSQTEGPLIFRQARLGEHGRLFTIYKFRTMRADAESAGEAVWASAHDPRLTRAGAVMRKLRLDELPQLWNVLRGEMSLVGPRPERPEFLAELSDRVPFWAQRHLIKPGLTGWAQVRQGYAGSAEETATKLSYDMWYLRHRSLTVDLGILMRTVAVVLRGELAAGSGSATVPTTNTDPYTDLHDRALSQLGAGAARLVSLPVAASREEASVPGELDVSRGVGRPGH